MFCRVNGIRNFFLARHQPYDCPVGKIQFIFCNQLENQLLAVGFGLTPKPVDALAARFMFLQFFYCYFHFTFLSLPRARRVFKDCSITALQRGRG
ncbi:hypothetical protein CCP3SC15_4280002 [Gammaproteobacteria bacterium]